MICYDFVRRLSATLRRSPPTHRGGINVARAHLDRRWEVSDYSEMIRFDGRALFVALDAERTARAMSWRDLARETGVTVSTIKRLELDGRLEVDGMLAMVSWLGRSVESFTRSSER